MILDELAAYAKKRVEKALHNISFDEMRERALALPKGNFSFTSALKKDGLSFICEVKKASPSKGLIDPVFDYTRIAREYESAGSDCVSCLTEPSRFLGSDKIFSDIREEISLPMLRKDFTVSAYQLYESKCLGADAALLICALLNADKLQKYLEICRVLGLSALVEAHDADEIKKALGCGAEIIGVNNRNLKDFSVDMKTAENLRALVPESVLFVSESGVKTPADIAAASSLGADAVLVGEAMMRSADKKNTLMEFREAARDKN